MDTIFLIIILIFSVIIHEIAHGSVAYYLGDPTAKYAGRLTLNPIKHLDFFGSIILPLLLLLFRSPILFGYAKPVPINPYNFRDQKYGSLKVALAGPLSNLSIALFFALIFRFIPVISDIPGISLMFAGIIFINILLAIFNLIPIPPLDGSHILFSLLPYSAGRVKIFFEQYGMFVLLIVIYLIIMGIIPLMQVVLFIYRIMGGIEATQALVRFFELF